MAHKKISQLTEQMTVNDADEFEIENIDGNSRKMKAATLKAYAQAGLPGSPEWGGIGGTIGDQTDLQAALDAKLDDSQIDTDPTLAANSNTRVPSQAAVISYVASMVAGLLDLKGDLDCSTNPNYPAGSKGDAYYVTVNGKIGGASGEDVTVGDLIIAKADNAGGTEASVGGSWFVIEHNIAAMLPLTGGTLTGDLQVPDDAYDATSWNGSTKVPTRNAVRDALVALAASVPSAYTDEMARDAIGAALVAGANVTITVDDAGNTITIAAKQPRIVNLQIIGTALTANEILAAITPPSGETWTFGANFSGASGKKLSGGTNPASSYAIDVKKNGSSVGTITISTGGAVSFATSGGAPFSLTGGADELQVVGPATPDTALGYAIAIPVSI